MLYLFHPVDENVAEVGFLSDLLQRMGSMTGARRIE